MGLQDRIAAALGEAEEQGETTRLSILRLIEAAIRDHEIAVRSGASEEGIDDDAVRAILSRMAAQRRESAREYERAARLEQAERKIAEAEEIEAFLPQQLSEREIDEAICAAIAEKDARSIRDLGHVMALLKSRLPGQFDAAELKARVQQRLES